MNKLIRGLARAYRAHHEVYQSQLEWIGLVGAIAFPLLYLVRFTGKLPPRWDDLEYRIVATVFCLLLALRRWWPRPLRRFYLPFSWAGIFYCLAFLMPLTLLQNRETSNITVVNMMLGVVLIIFLTDWRNTIAMLLAGYVLSFAVYWFTHPVPELPFQFLYVWVPICAVMAAGGVIARINERRAEAERLRLIHSGAGSIAHEMRNPLMGVRHALDTLAQAVPATQPGRTVELTHEQARAIVQAVAQGQEAVTRGLQAINVTLAQLKPGAIDPAGFRCLWAASCVHKAVSEFAYESAAHRARVRIEQRGDFAFMGDETAFILVLFNLIRNALFYLPTHPDIVITLTVDGATGQVRVRDTGPGVPAELQHHLFEEFSTRGKPQGTGLGLAFCRRALRAFGGDIDCHSRAGEFTEFRLRLPALAPAEVAAQEARALRRAREALAGKRVLVVDDEPLVRRATAGRLAALGCETGTAADGEEALAALAHGGFDLVLMDLHMPVLDGLEATRRLRAGALPEQSSVPVVGFGAGPSSVAEVKAQRAGMDGYLSKGCPALEMFEVLARAVAAAPSGRGVGTRAALRGRTALVVDDSGFNRKVMKARLAELGMQAIEARHGAEALALLQSGVRPAVVVTDMQMPGLDGVELARAVRALPGAAGKVPMMAVTADASAQRMAAARAAGIDGFLVKPVEPPALRAELARLLAAAGASPSDFQPLLADAGVGAQGGRRAVEHDAAVAHHERPVGD